MCGKETGNIKNKWQKAKLWPTKNGLAIRALFNWDPLTLFLLSQEQSMKKKKSSFSPSGCRDSRDCTGIDMSSVSLTYFNWYIHILISKTRISCNWNNWKAYSQAQPRLPIDIYPYLKLEEYQLKMLFSGSATSASPNSNATQGTDA